MADVFFFQRLSDADTAKVEMADGLCKYSATCEFQWLISGCTWLIAVPFLYISYEIFSENADGDKIRGMKWNKRRRVSLPASTTNPRQIMKQKQT